jgi:hypothetical protein
VASSEVQICNFALSNCRDARYIEARDEQTEQAIQCDLWYDDTRDELLRRADWGFARKRLALVPSGDPPAEWVYRYALPADCIMPRGIEDGVRVRTFDQSLKYAIEGDGTGHGKVILMDVTDAVLIYTMRVADVAIYPPEFVKALSWELAACIALPLAKSQEIVSDTIQKSEAFTGRAIVMNLNEHRPDAAPDSDLYTSRIG